MKQRSSSGILALVFLAALYGLTAVLARYLGKGLGVFEQWYLRYGLGCLFAAIFFRKQIRYKKFLSLPLKEWMVLLFRVITGSVVAIALYTLAAQKAKIGPVAFMQVVPTTALFGVLILHEKISFKKAGLVLLCFLGAAIVAVNNFHDVLGFNDGELLSLVSGAIFSLVLITRRWHTGVLNNQELTVAMTGLGAVANYVVSLTLYHRVFVPNRIWNVQFSLVLLVAGLSTTAIFFLFNYGFEHVAAVVASTILDLELVFGALFGYVFYRETLATHELIGGLIILAAAIAMNQLSTKESRDLKAIPSPD